MINDFISAESPAVVILCLPSLFAPTTRTTRERDALMMFVSIIGGYYIVDLFEAYQKLDSIVTHGAIMLKETVVLYEMSVSHESKMSVYDILIFCGEPKFYYRFLPLLCHIHHKDYMDEYSKEVTGTYSKIHHKDYMDLLTR